MLMIAVVTNQSHFMFFPTHRTEKNKAWKVEGKYIGVKFETANPRQIFFLMHGNCGQADERTYFLGVLPQGTSLYVLEYPGYGPRRGKRTQQSIDRAALEAYDALRANFPELPITVIGESIGNGPAAYVAGQRNPENLVLLTPYHDFPSLAQEKVPVFPAYWLCHYRWDIPKALENYSGKTLIIGASHDEIIPPEQTRKLAEALPQAEFIVIDGGHDRRTVAKLKEILASI